MTFLYIGQYTEGTTSKMRANQILKILKPKDFKVIDTHIPFHSTPKILRSIGFRYKIGPLIKNVNDYIQEHINESSYDLIWVDKGIFINKKTIALLRHKTNKLVHFTPDPAFTYHQSKFFDYGVAYYDYLITTKSYELDHYYKKKDKNQVLYVTQGFDKDLHKKGDVKFEDKKGLAFLGHYEKEREVVIQQLIDHNVNVTLAGIKWESFAKKNASSTALNYLGKGVYGKDYVSTIQQAKIAWGAISKWVPELHTTRTFEIPACKTALLTERNQETEEFFNDNEVIFYDNTQDLVVKVLQYLKDDEALRTIIQNGYNKVLNEGYDYMSILSKVLKRILND